MDDNRLAAVADDTYVVEDLTAKYHASLSTINAWIKQGLIPPPFRVGRRRLWRRSAIDTHLARLAGAAVPSTTEGGTDAAQA